MPRFDKSSAKRIGNSTRRVEKQPINTLKQKQRRRPPEDGKCAAYKYRITLLGEPTDGDFKLLFTWANEDIGTEEITLDFNESPSGFENLLLGLEGVKDPDDENGSFAADNGVRATGEDFPYGSMIFRLIGKGKGGRLLEMTVSENNLTGGAHVRVRIEPVCC